MFHNYKFERIISHLCFTVNIFVSLFIWITCINNTYCSFSAMIIQNCIILWFYLSSLILSYPCKHVLIFIKFTKVEASLASCPFSFALIWPYFSWAPSFLRFLLLLSRLCRISNYSACDHLRPCLYYIPQGVNIHLLNRGRTFLASIESFPCSPYTAIFSLWSSRPLVSSSYLVGLRVPLICMRGSPN